MTANARRAQYGTPKRTIDNGFASLTKGAHASSTADMMRKAMKAVLTGRASGLSVRRLRRKDPMLGEPNFCKHRFRVKALDEPDTVYWTRHWEQIYILTSTNPLSKRFPAVPGLIHFPSTAPPLHQV